MIATAETLGKLGSTQAHEDDNIPKIASADPGAIHELIFTAGENGENLRPNAAESDFVSSGRRVEEGAAAAKSLKFQSHTFVGHGDEENKLKPQKFEDGKLAGKQTEAEMAAVIEQWAEIHAIESFVTLATGDHPDHDAVARATRIAARSLSKKGKTIRVLELQPKGTDVDPTRTDVIVVQSTEEGARRSLYAAAHSPSQFEITQIDPQTDADKELAQIHAPNVTHEWIEVAGFKLEPKTYRRLFQYPIGSTAVYLVTEYNPDDPLEEHELAA
jgi:LmbE family N-acetylglucosaminyl deacetylase